MSLQSGFSLLPLGSVPSFQSSPVTPIAHFGEYAIHTLDFCSEDVVSDVFAKTCARGNPLLQGRPYADLVTLGRAIYRKSLPLGFSQVAMHKGKCIALNTSWDVAEGGAWKDSGLTMPASVAAHAACAKACFETLDQDAEGPIIFAAFCGVLPGHSGQLFGVLGVSTLIMARDMGYKRSFLYTVLPVIIGRSAGDERLKRTEEHKISWLKFEDMPSDNEAVVQELKDLGGTSQITNVCTTWSAGSEYIGALAPVVKLDEETLTAKTHEIAYSHLARLGHKSMTQHTAKL